MFLASLAGVCVLSLETKTSRTTGAWYTAGIGQCLDAHDDFDALVQDKIRTPPIGVPGERTAGCKYYCDRQTARTESKWTSQERGELYGNQGTLEP